MADPKRPEEEPPVTSDDGEPSEVETNRALEQGLGVGARELAAIHESGAKGTLERAEDAEPGSEDEEPELDGDALGRSASVLDEDDEEQSSKTSDA